MNHLDLFSGIGGFSLAAQRVWGKEHNIVAFCENDKYCQRVLKKHWPDVPIIDDVRDIYRFTHEYKDVFGDGENMLCERHDMDFADCACIGCSQFDDEYGAVDLITGGFPCQDISLIGKGVGIEGNRSGLWTEMFRIICLLRPEYVIIENVPALISRGGTSVLGSLAQAGYDAEWQIISAAQVGAWHKRERIWIVAYPHSKMLEGYAWDEHKREKWQKEIRRNRQSAWSQNWIEVATKLCGMDTRIPSRVDRLKALGNSIVPQVVEVIMRGIKEVNDTGNEGY